MSTPHDVTQILLRWSDGDQEALDRLLPLVYDQLKKLARARLQGERPDHTLNATALVHEAYLRLVDINQVQWKDRAHFLAMASRQMRRILIDYAERHKAQKRGGGAVKEVLNEEHLITENYAESLLELDDALQQMEKTYPRHVKAVELYYFAGLTLKEVSEVLNVSSPTVMRDIRFAQAWLANEWRGT